MTETIPSSVPVSHPLANAVPLLWVVLATLLFLPSMQQLSFLWTELGDAGYGHGPLLAIVSAWMLWQAGGGPVHRGGVHWWWAAPLGASTVAWAAALASSTSSIGLALWPIACWFGLAFLYGARQARRYALALALLYFALPVWTPLTNWVLWPLTIKVSQTVVQWLGLNAFVDRNFITIPSGQFEIIAGCSGQHFFLVAAVLGLLVAHLNGLRGRSYAVVVFAAIVAALVTNWIRVVSIVVVGYYTEMQHPIVAEGHLLFGWFLFAAVIIGFCVWARWYVRRLPDAAFVTPPPAHAPLAASLIIAVGCAAAIVAIGPVWYAAAQTQIERVAAQRVSFSLPLGHDGWVGPVFAESPLKPEFAGATTERRGSYVGGSTVHVYANLYTRQSQGAELVGYGNVVLSDANWRLDTQADAGSEQSFRQLTVDDSSGQRWFVRHAYVVDGRTFASETASKLALGIEALAFQAPRAGVVVFAAPCATVCDEVATNVRAAWEQLVPELLTYYRSTVQG